MMHILSKHPLLSIGLLSLALSSTTAQAANNPWATLLGKNNNAYVAQTNASSADVDDYNKITLIPRYRIITQNRWANTPATDIITALNALKTSPRSAVLRSYWQELAMGNFDRVSFSSPRQQQQIDLFAARLNTLIKLGDFGGATRLYQAIDTSHIPEQVARLGVEAMSLAGQTEAACLEVSLIAQNIQTPEWLENRTMCAVYEGDPQTARSLINTMVAQKTPVSATFKTLMGQLAQGKMTRGVRNTDPALWQSIAVSLGAGLPNLSAASGQNLAFLAQHPKVPLATRTIAADRATALGYMNPDLLKHLFEENQFNYSEADANAVRSAIDAGKALPNVRIYAAARKTFTGNARAKLIEGSIKHMAGPNDPRVLAWITLIDKLSLQPQNMPWFAPRAYAVLAMTGRQIVADLYESKTGNVVASSTVGIMRGFTHPDAWQAANLQRWQQAMVQKFGAKAAQPRIERVLHIVTSHGSQAAKDILLQNMKSTGKLLSNNPTNVTPLWVNAAKKGQRGLALAYALKALDNNSSSLLDSQQLEEMLTSFHKGNLWVEQDKISLAITLENVL